MAKSAAQVNAAGQRLLSAGNAWPIGPEHADDALVAHDGLYVGVPALPEIERVAPVRSPR